MRSIDEFETIVNEVVGVYYDATTAFSKQLKWFEDMQKKGLKIMQKNNPEFTKVEDFDSVPFMYGVGHPDKQDSRILHRCTQGEYKDRNREHGLNYQFLGNMVIVAIYQYWEDFFRAKIASELGIKKSKLQETIMGDIRLIRNSIIHNAGIADKKTEGCVFLSCYKEGEEIFIDEAKFEKIIKLIREMIEDIRCRCDNYQH